jgi:LemA protein
MKKFLIGGGVVVAIALLVFIIGMNTNNSAISLEEQISGAKAQIEVQEKRRVDLIGNLVDVVLQSAEYEKATLTGVVDERTPGSDTESSRLMINAVAEAYPTLKANENYKELMNELSATENGIAEYRNNYNLQVRSYRKLVRTFPNNVILNILGYETVESEYTEYDAPETAPQNLFGGK